MPENATRWSSAFKQPLARSKGRTLADYFDAVVDGKVPGPVDLWVLYEQAGAILLTAAADLGEFKAESVHLKASDDSVTINRKTPSEARAVLDDLSLSYKYSFY